MDSEENGVTLLEDEDPHHPPKLPIPDEHAFGSKNITFFGLFLCVNSYQTIIYSTIISLNFHNFWKKIFIFKGVLCS